MPLVSSAFLFVLLQLLTIGRTITNQICALPFNFTSDTYSIPKTTPLVSISFNRVTPEPVRLFQPDIYMNIIENMPSICSVSPFLPFIPRADYEYGTAVIVIENANCGTVQSLKYDDVCAAMRGLAERMSMEGEFYEWEFQILVAMRTVGFGYVNNRRRLGVGEVAKA